MRKIFLFMNISLDGYVEDAQHDLAAFHTGGGDDAFEAFSLQQSQAVDTLLFGRKTYEMMRSYWPTPEAAQNAPEIARFMNEKHKVVASRQPFEPGWSNVSVISPDAVEAVRSLKAQPGNTIAVFGSNNLCVSLVQAGLIDEFQIMLNPVVFGDGTSLFKRLPEKTHLRLADARPFKSGRVLLTYQSTG